MPGRLLPIEQVLALLPDMPKRIAALSADLEPAQLRAPPSPDEWSAVEVLSHLRSCADVWGACIETMIEQEAPTLRAINPTTWIDRTDYRELDFRSSLDAFSEQRTELIATLESLRPEDWLRTATVTGAGKPLVRSVHFYAQWLARHERSHVRQVERVTRGLPSQ